MKYECGNYMRLGDIIQDRSENPVGKLQGFSGNRPIMVDLQEKRMTFLSLHDDILHGYKLKERGNSIRRDRNGIVFHVEDRVEVYESHDSEEPLFNDTVLSIHDYSGIDLEHSRMIVPDSNLKVIKDCVVIPKRK